MFEKLFDRPSRIQSLRDGPGGPLLESFAKELCQGGYAKISARPGYGHSNRLQLLNGARLFLKHLWRAVLISTPDIESTTQDPVLFTEFCQWMRRQRGTTP
jgi:hypothetical protein